ncbi:uncharacterized protein LOC134706658 [Mytilus trossulus]|uniref:uncharacterized protein LOC134706658 n=1 Tax=Mytilus trossulus TaxID=6551 RepID=UPI0030079827
MLNSLPDTAYVSKGLGNMIALLIFMLVSLNCVYATCNYHGTVHQLGTSFDAIDGCNICFCKTHGISCTEKHCMNPPADKR